MSAHSYVQDAQGDSVLCPGSRGGNKLLLSKLHRVTPCSNGLPLRENLVLLRISARKMWYVHLRKLGSWLEAEAFSSQHSVERHESLSWNTVISFQVHFNRRSGPVQPARSRGPNLCLSPAFLLCVWDTRTPFSWLRERQSDYEAQE